MSIDVQRAAVTAGPLTPLVYSRRARTSEKACGAMPRMNGKPLTVAVVGATGVVGRTMIQVLKERDFPIGELRLLASGRSAGRSVVGRRPDASRSRKPTPRRSTASTSPCSRAGADISRELAPAAAARGATVIETRPPGGWSPTSRSSSRRSTRTT